MPDFVITQNHMLAKIGQLTVENDVLRSQLRATAEQLAALQEQVKVKTEG